MCSPPPGIRWHAAIRRQWSRRVVDPPLERYHRTTKIVPGEYDTGELEAHRGHYYNSERPSPLSLLSESLLVTDDTNTIVGYAI